ncbi:MAG TPA: HD domain-containing phosphohydrolase [Gemmataceae bacterium]|jgi:response regulator RpfG family c-di-GMP phosphodiesterase|nr:HD domain-containing phosphohydrolase [Gemmataceae bacterium]
MSGKILCVDDESHVLAGYERQLRKQFDIETALGGEQGLSAIASRGPFAVIVTDMRMPGMSGIEFLGRARELTPDSVRMMLTGNNDQQTATSAVNDGNVFRFLNKPCPAETLAEALRAGLEQYRLITAEKQLLEQTLHGSIKVLTDLLSLVSPVAFGRATRVQRLVRKVAEILKVPGGWQLDIAAMLSQIGCVTVPETVLETVYGGGDLPDEERRMFERHPQIGRGLIAQIPRLEAVAEIVAYQEKHFDGQGLPADEVKGESIPLGARILKATLDYESLSSRGQTPTKVIESLKGRGGWHDPAVVGALETLSRAETTYARKMISFGDMRPRMILDDNILNVNGVLLVGKGQEITDTLLHRLGNLHSQHKIREPIAVLTAMD